MVNTNNIAMENNIKQGITAFREHGIPVPTGLVRWCIEHGREDLLGIESTKPSTEAIEDFFGLPNMSKLFGVEPPARYSGESLEDAITDADIEAWIEEASADLARQFGVEVPKPATESKDEDYPDLQAGI